MKDLLSLSAYFGMFLSITAYGIGILLHRKLRLGMIPPFLIAVTLVIVILVPCGIDYDTYNSSAKYLTYFLTPATVCLAIPLYQQLELLKQNWKAILTGITAGVLTNLGSILVFCLLFGLNHQQYVTLLPKSVTTAIGIGISQELGGVVPITVAVICLTGITGNAFSHLVCRWFRLTHPVAKGVAIGTASHVIGTVRALEMGEAEGAMGGLAIAVTGLITVVGASIFAHFL